MTGAAKMSVCFSRRTRVQTKVRLCAPSTDDLWKIPCQRRAKAPGRARRDSGGMPDWEGQHLSRAREGMRGC